MTPAQLKVLELTAELLLSQYSRERMKEGTKQNELAVALIDLYDEDADSDSAVKLLFETKDYMDECGVIRVEKWPEGLVFWAGGSIWWKSWKEV